MPLVKSKMLLSRHYGTIVSGRRLDATIWLVWARTSVL